MTHQQELNKRYWNELSDEYADDTYISTDDFHYGPLVPGDSELGLLPTRLKDLRCLELGSGAAQNSIYLAKQGAICTATDISLGQLGHGLVAKQNLPNLSFIVATMEELPFEPSSFDLVHSSYALAFSPEPEQVIRNAYDLLCPGGRFILSTAHPLFSGEWLELDEEEEGIFITDYFSPVPDIRYNQEGEEETRSCSYPISQMFAWLTDSGFQVEHLVEPRAIAPGNAVPPYSSEKWFELQNELRKIPVAIIFSCWKPVL